MSLHVTIQKAILTTIDEPQFNAALPPLSDETWVRLLSPSSKARAENERLEFLGDALMYATIGRQLYSQIPDGSPHLYTSVRAALHSNATFSHLAERLDILAVSSTVLHALTRRTFGEGNSAPAKSKCQVKATADLFETVIGAYYLDHGFEALGSWVKDLYGPLIASATQAFRNFRVSRPLLKGKRPVSVDSAGCVPERTPKRLRSSDIQAQTDRHFVQIAKANSRKRSNISGNTATSHPVLTSNVLSSDKGTASRASNSHPELVDRRRNAASRPSRQVLIDLTVDSDSGDSEQDRFPGDEAAYLVGISSLAVSSPSRSPSGPRPVVSQRLFGRSTAVTRAGRSEPASSEEENMLEEMLVLGDLDAHETSVMDISMSSDWDCRSSVR